MRYLRATFRIASLLDEEILERLVVLNHERAAEEAAGKIRWLRPVFQRHQTGEPTKTQLSFADEEEDEEETRGKGRKKSGPKLATSKSKAAKSEGPATVAEPLETLVAVGQARVTAGGQYAP